MVNLAIAAANTFSGLVSQYSLSLISFVVFSETGKREIDQPATKLLRESSHPLMLLFRNNDLVRALDLARALNHANLSEKEFDRVNEFLNRFEFGLDHLDFEKQPDDAWNFFDAALDSLIENVSNVLYVKQKWNFKFNTGRIIEYDYGLI